MLGEREEFKGTVVPLGDSFEAESVIAGVVWRQLREHRAERGQSFLAGMKSRHQTLSDESGYKNLEFQLGSEGGLATTGIAFDSSQQFQRAESLAGGANADGKARCNGVHRQRFRRRKEQTVNLAVRSRIAEKVGKFGKHFHQRVLKCPETFSHLAWHDRQSTASKQVHFILKSYCLNKGSQCGGGKNLDHVARDHEFGPVKIPIPIVWVLFAGVLKISAASDYESRPFFERENFTGEWMGLRPLIEDRGVTLNAGYSVDVWGNTTGGLKTGSVYTGLLDFGAEIDLGKIAGFQGLTAGTTWLWLSGKDASADLVGNFLTISNIAGFNTLRMFELWLEQEFFNGRASLKIGQLAPDGEFLVSDYSGLFLNAEFGWTALAGMNMPSGGPVYPVGALGVRLQAELWEDWTVLAGIFQGDVFAQDVNRHGFRWRLDAETGYTALVESQLRWGNDALPGYLKTGAWFQSGAAADPLANRTSSGNCGFYGVLDQAVWRKAGEEGLGIFVRSGFAPPDRNLVDFFLDTGLNYRGLIPGRGEDTTGLAMGLASMTGGQQALLQAEGATAADCEIVFEATHQCVLTPWLVVQPDLQWIIQPGANAAVPNALVIGGRVALVF